MKIGKKENKTKITKKNPKKKNPTKTDVKNSSWCTYLIEQRNTASG